MILSPTAKFSPIVKYLLDKNLMPTNSKCSQLRKLIIFKLIPVFSTGRTLRYRPPTSIGNSVRFNWPHVTGKANSLFTLLISRDPPVTKGAVWVPTDLYYDSG